MNHTAFNVLQTLLMFTFVLWIICLGVAVMFQQHRQYFQWTGQALRNIWRHSWQFLVGLAIGYFLLGIPLLDISH